MLTTNSIRGSHKQQGLNSSDPGRNRNTNVHCRLSLLCIASSTLCLASRELWLPFWQEGLWPVPEPCFPCRSEPAFTLPHYPLFRPIQVTSKPSWEKIRVRIRIACLQAVQLSFGFMWELRAHDTTRSCTFCRHGCAPVVKMVSVGWITESLCKLQIDYRIW